jgi:hypothetical protein
MRKYIKTNRNDFFPKKIREKFFKLVDKIGSNAFEDSNNLLELFNEIDIENQTRIIYVFDHILW